MSADRDKGRMSLAASAATLIVSGGLITVSNFAMNIVLANAISKADFGTYKQVYLLYGVISPFFVLAAPSSMLYFIPRLEPERRKVVVYQTMVLLGFTGVLFGVLLFFGAPLFAHYFHNPALVVGMRIFALLPLFGLPAGVFYNMAVAYGKALWGGATTLVFSLTNFAAVSAVALLGGSLAQIMWAAVLANALFFVLSITLTLKLAGPPSFGWDWELVRRQIAYVVPLALAGFTNLLAYQTDRLLVSFFFAPAVYAIYVVGAVEVPIVSTINSAVNAVVAAKVSELHSKGMVEQLRTLYRESVRKTSIIVMPFFGALMFMAADFITFLYHGYVASVPVFRIYLLVLPLRCATYSLILSATGHTKPIFRGSAYQLAGNLALSYVLIRVLLARFGEQTALMGPAIGTVLVIFLGAAYWLSHAGKVVGVPGRTLLPWGALASALALSVVAGLAGWSVAHLAAGLEGLFALAVGLPVCAVVYLAGGRLIGVLQADDVARLRSWLVSAVKRFRPGAAVSAAPADVSSDAVGMEDDMGEGA